MQRIGNLIAKLKEQYESGATPEQMLVTLRMLQSELLQAGFEVTDTDTRNISVTVPATPQRVESVYKKLETISEEDESSQGTINPEQEIEERRMEMEALKIEEEWRKQYLESSQQATGVRETGSIVGEKGVEGVGQAAGFRRKESGVKEQVSGVREQEEKKKVELNDSIAEKKTELNETLKQDATEVAHKLKDTPIKDLRKAIGINDKFVFVSELFRGDEDLFERSVKTLNTFSIYPEAEYWMRKELIVKLGWDARAIHVQEFIQLVRRRFS
jgi:hypothetical protein